MFVLKQTRDSGKNNWPYSFLSRPRLLVVMLNIDIHIQAINACLKCINNSVIFKFNLGNYLLQIIYSTALLDHKPSSTKNIEIQPTMSFVHITVPQCISDLRLPMKFWYGSYTRTASICKALTSHLEYVILQERRWETAEIGSIEMLHTLVQKTATT